MWDTHPPIAERIHVLEQLAGARGAPSATTSG
jgi:Zn-dependent protease with chaperone function